MSANMPGAADAAPFSFPRSRPDALRVAVVPERYGQVFSPCASIRLQPYFHAMSLDGDTHVRYMLPGELRRFAPDVVVWHRVSIADREQLDLLDALRGARGTRLVFDLDDNLLDLEDHGERAVYEPMRAAVRESIALADEVWTSTPRLAVRAARATRAAVNVMPNALAPDLWSADALDARLRAHLPAPSPAAWRGRKPLQLLYMGTRTHDHDFTIVEQALDRLHADQPGSFRLSMVGVRARKAASPAWLRTIQAPGHVGASYPAFVSWFRTLSGFDLGIAPLLASDFNDCKSPIKVLDYAAIGLPTLASAVPAYMDSLRSGVDCLHAGNDPYKWAGALAALAADRSALPAITAAARDLVAPGAFDKGVALRRARVHHRDRPA
jgi:hypothetical protein